MIGSQSRFLLIHRFFKPDSPPYAFILEDLRSLLIGKGLAVDVLSSQPSYKSIDKKNKLPWKVNEQCGSRIFRLPVFQLRSQKITKFLNFIWFPFLGFVFILLGKKYHAVMVSTSPPVLLAFLVSLACKIRGIKLIYHCMDIHPEIGQISGEFKNNLIFNMLSWMDMFTCRISAKIIVLSEDMKTSLLNRNTNLASKIEIINNYDLNEEGQSRQGFFNKNDGKKRVIFAGNIGRFQNLDNFVLAIKNNPQLENFELIFVGEGAALKPLKGLAAGLEKQVRFISHQPISIARQMIADVDLAIVSLQSKVVRYAFPSKTMTYLAVGTPILAMVERDSELAHFVISNNVGYVVEPGDISGIYDFFLNLTEGKVIFDKLHITDTFEEKFSKNQFNKKFIDVFESLN